MHDVPRFHQRFLVDAPIHQVRAFHSSPEALQALTPPPVRVELRRFGEMKEGMEAEFVLHLGPLTIPWTARHENVNEDGFDDVQVSGPMAAWRHRHRFESDGEDRTWVDDEIEYAHPSGLSGLGTRLMFGKLGLIPTFLFRRWATRTGVRRLAPS